MRNLVSKLVLSLTLVSTLLSTAPVQASTVKVLTNNRYPIDLHNHKIPLEEQIRLGLNQYLNDMRTYGQHICNDLHTDEVFTTVSNPHVEIGISQVQETDFDLHQLLSARIHNHFMRANAINSSRILKISDDQRDGLIELSITTRTIQCERAVPAAAHGEGHFIRNAAIGLGAGAFLTVGAGILMQQSYCYCLRSLADGIRDYCVSGQGGVRTMATAATKSATQQILPVIKDNAEEFVRNIWLPAQF